MHVAAMIVTLTGTLIRAAENMNVSIVAKMQNYIFPIANRYWQTISHYFFTRVSFAESDRTSF